MVIAICGSTLPQCRLNTDELDSVFEKGLSAHVPHPTYGDETIPAYDMIRFLGQHYAWLLWWMLVSAQLPSMKARVIQSRSEDSIIREIENIRDKTPGIHRYDFRPGRSNGKHVSVELQI